MEKLGHTNLYCVQQVLIINVYGHCVVDFGVKKIGSLILAK